jgi:hypothetical protein
VTAAGRGLAVALMLMGIAAFGVLTAELVSLFVRESDDVASRHLLQVDARLRRIEDALQPVQRRRARRAAQARSRNRRKRRQRTTALPRISEAEASTPPQK